MCEKPPEAIQSMPSRISEEEEICVSDKFKSKKCKEERSLEISAHERGAASLSGREVSKHFTQCHICKQSILWIDFNAHVPACASIAVTCSLCGEHVPSYEIKEHMENHFPGKVNTSFNVPENESSNETTYMSNQSTSAKSKAYSSGMKCPYCSEVCSADQVLEHTRSCRKNVYECPLCGKKVPEKDKKHHEEFQCRMVQDNTESKTSDFSRHSQSNSECPLCYKLLPEENYDVHVTLQCEKVFQVGGTHALYAAGENLYECIYCSEKMPQKEKTKHHSFLCKVLIESSGISISEKKQSSSSQADVSESVIDKGNAKYQELSSLDAKDVTLLLESMKELLIKGNDHDVKITVKDKQFQAHRIILRTRSPVFAMMLTHDSKESITSTINIEDCDPDSFDEFLLYLYSGRTENLTPAKALHLYYTADKYDIPALKERCVILLKTSLSVESICDVLLLATRHDEKELLEQATKFFARNMREILVTVHWQKFLSNNPIEGNELYIKSMEILVPRK